MTSKIRLSRVPYKVYYHHVTVAVSEPELRALHAVILGAEKNLYAADRLALLRQIDLLINNLEQEGWSLAELQVKVAPDDLALSRIEGIATVLRHAGLHLEQDPGEWVQATPPPIKISDAGGGSVGEVPIRGGSIDGGLPASGTELVAIFTNPFFSSKGDGGGSAP